MERERELVHEYFNGRKSKYEESAAAAGLFIIPLGIEDI